jgi:hypothetical protein
MQSIVWAPQPRQKILLDCPYKEVFFGGARGGGKSNGILGKYGLKSSHYKHVNAIFFRKELPQADDLIEEAKEIYLPLGAHWRDQKKIFEFPTGSRVRFRPLESEKDAEKYQGQNLTDCAVEEAGNYPDPKPIDKLFGALRSKHGVPTQLLLTANPGGVGHLWIKERYIDPAPLGLKALLRRLPNGKDHKYIYIPSKVQDNRILLTKDPDYINNLYLVGSETLVKAWLEGDWSIIEGAYFSEFSIPRHVIQPFKIPKRWKKYIGFDWGFNSPFCAVWGAVSDGKDDAGNEIYTSDGRHIQKGAIVVYREYSGTHTPNENIAREILRLSKDEEITLAVADPSIFNSNGGETIADQFNRAGLVFRPADNERVAGWQQLRKRLRPELDPKVQPMVYFFNNSSYLIKTIPTAPIDEKHPEDLDTAFDDHALDAFRYLLMENLLVRTGYREPEVHATKGVIKTK